MNKLLLIIGILFPGLAFLLAGQTVADLPDRIDADGHLLRTRIRGEGSPTVVFEIGLGGPLEEWASVQSEVARFTRTVAYDRLGSDHRSGILTGREIVQELRTALRNANVQPPYVLVGQSFAGIYNRLFASMNPDEVVGLILLDPAQEEFIDWMEVHHPKHGLSSIPKVNWPEAAGIEATLKELKSSQPLPNIPIIVVTGTRPNANQLRDHLLPTWTQMHKNWVTKLPQGRHVLAEQSGHGVHVEQPELVVELIRDIVQQVRNR